MGEVIESSNDSKNEIPDKLNNSYNLRKNKFNTTHDTNTSDPEEPASKKIKIEDKNGKCLYLSDTLNYDDGSIYVGGLANNMHQGYGTLKAQNYKYHGFWNKGKYDGNGLFCCDDYDHQGYWKENLKHGFGKTTITSETILKEFSVKSFEGNFDSNNLVGTFNINYLNNDKYRGEIKITICNGIQIPVPQGEGELEYFTGEKYEGYFDSGRFSGEGIYICNREKFIGVFENNTIVNGKLKNDYYEYEGGFKNYKKHGRGLINFKDGRVCNGRFYKGDFTYGILKKNNKTFKGNFKNYKLEGYGSAFINNLLCFMGDFEQGKLINPSKGLAKCSACRSSSNLCLCDGCKIFTNSKCNICYTEKPVILFDECRHAITCYDCTKELIKISFNQQFESDDEESFDYYDSD